ncbi:uncharacterized protein LY89DRAFT_722697 [Mollisia scopiformis]|uniref:2EXR domain-containing protein n=1 Tax=Mollisia scopiformis TaxID=149040 RepID=A0A194WV82_MOLSC|nr:uncharacterized protein LY89DRAFT_722697 [Mollisia scopiformis]KUJ11574.1 hypothetical protein LY89DRAFT_722697 [Mollisia scopiformis]
MSNKEIVAMERTFTVFGLLPTELRLRIWEFAIPGPRTICLNLVPCKDETRHMAIKDEGHDTLDAPELRDGETAASGSADPRPTQEDESDSESDYEESIRSPFVTEVAFRSDCSPPSLLSVCQESRAVASKHYNKTFATPYAPGNTYFDFDRDTIYVRYNTVSPNGANYPAFIKEMFRVREGGLATISRVAILVRLDEPLSARGGCSLELLVSDILLRVFPRLEKLTIVLAEWAADQDDSSSVRFMDPIEYEERILNNGLFPPEHVSGQMQEELDWNCLYYAKIRPEVLSHIISQKMTASDIPPLMPSIDYKLAFKDSEEEYIHSVRERLRKIWGKGRNLEFKKKMVIIEKQMGAPGLSLAEVF